MAVSLRNIASELEVSTAAVSKALNDLPGISDGLRVRVKQVADRMGYTKHLKSSSARGRERGMRFIAVLIGPIGGHLIEQIQSGVNASIRRGGYCELRYLVGSSPALGAERGKEVLLKSILRERGVVGILACYVNLPDPLISLAYEHGVSVVLLENHTEFGRCVTIDQVRASQRAVSAFIDLGRRNIGCIMPLEEVDHVARDRLHGYRRALKERGLAYDPGLIVYADWEGVRAGELATSTLLRIRPAVDAVLYGSDREAYGGLKALRDAGRRVPEDVNVIGFDDMEFNTAITPSLSSVRQPVRKMAETGLRLLLDSIEKGDRSHRSVSLDTELILRASCTGRP